MPFLEQQPAIASPDAPAAQTDVAVLRRTRERLMGSQQFTELARIPIRVGPPSEDGRLAPTMDGDTVVLRSRVPEGTPSPIGVNVDALLLLDALEDGTVFEVEVLVPQSAWRSRESAPRSLSAIDKGSIVIADPGPNIYVDQVSAYDLTCRSGYDLTCR